MKLGPFEIDILTNGLSFQGIGRISCNGTALRSGEYFMLPCAIGTGGERFTRWMLDGVEQGDNAGAVVGSGEGKLSLHTGRTGLYFESDFATLSLERERVAHAVMRLELAADSWLGCPRLRMRTVITSDDCELISVVERGSWELGGTTDGVTYLAQRWGCENGGWECRLDRDTAFSTRDAMAVGGKPCELAQLQARGFGGPSMEYQYSARGALVLFREEQGLVRGMADKAPGAATLQYVDESFRDRGPRVDSPWLSVVLYQPSGPWDELRARNLWSRFFDHYAASVARRTGISRPMSLPGIGCESWNFGSGRFFEHQKAKLPAIAALGARRVLLHTLPHPHDADNCCGIFDYTIPASEGGIGALREYCDAADRLGLKVIMWIGGALHRNAPLVKKHADWFVRMRDGSVFGAGYHCLAVLDMGHPRVYRFMRESIERLIVQGGIRGVWVDSLLNAWGHSYSWHRPVHAGGPGPVAPHVIRLLADLSTCGCEIFTEGISPFGMPMGGIGTAEITSTALTGNLQFAKLACGPEGLHRTNLWARGDTGGRGIGKDRYFRLLAMGAPLMVYYNTSDRDREKLGTADLPAPMGIPRYAELNEAYSRVSENLVVREVLADGRGVLWHPADNGDPLGDPSGAAGTRVLFSFGDRPIDIGGLRVSGAVDVCSGRRVPVGNDGSICRGRNRIYLLDSGHPEA